MNNADDEQVYAQPQYGIPDSQNLEVTKFLVGNDPFIHDQNRPDDEEAVTGGDLPPEMKIYFWSFLSKDIVLSNLNEGDIRMMKYMLESTIMSFEMALPPGRFDWHTLRDLDNLRNMSFLKSKRALGGFERKQQTTQIQQTLYGEARGQNEPKRGGFFSKFTGGFFGGNTQQQQE